MPGLRPRHRWRSSNGCSACRSPCCESDRASCPANFFRLLAKENRVGMRGPECHPWAEKISLRACECGLRKFLGALGPASPTIIGRPEGETNQCSTQNGAQRRSCRGTPKGAGRRAGVTFPPAACSRGTPTDHRRGYRCGVARTDQVTVAGPHLVSHSLSENQCV